MLSQEQAAQLRTFGLRQYTTLKGQMLLATALLVTLGSGVAFAAGGTPLALPFALGGASGMLYSWLLQQGVDGTVGGAAGEARVQPSPALSLQLALANPLSRVALLCAGMAGSLAVLHTLSDQVRRWLWGCGGLTRAALMVRRPTDTPPPTHHTHTLPRRPAASCPLPPTRARRRRPLRLWPAFCATKQRCWAWAPCLSPSRRG